MLTLPFLDSVDAIVELLVGMLLVYAQAIQRVYKRFDLLIVSGILANGNERLPENK